MLIKNAEALEVMEKVTILIVDKTGTLTVGKPSLYKVLTVGEFKENNILAMAATLEKASEHLLAEAIVQGAKDRKLILPEGKSFETFSGMGIRGIVGGHSVVLGNKKLLSTNNIDPSQLTEMAKELQSEGSGVMLMAIDEKPAGIVAVQDGNWYRCCYRECRSDYC